MHGWLKPILTAARVLLHLACHWTVAAIVVLVMKAFEEGLIILYGVPDPKFFNAVPIAYVFHATDLGVLIVVGAFSVVAIFNAMRE